MSTLSEIRAKVRSSNYGRTIAVPVESSSHSEGESEIAQAIIEVSQSNHEVSQPLEIPVTPVPSLSPRHQKKLGVPVTKVLKNDQVEKVRAIWRSYRVKTQAGA